MAKTHKPLYKSLYFQVIVAIVLGVLLGHFYPETGTAMKPLGDGFIKLIKMIIAPIIFCTVVVGIAGMEDMKKVGKTGGSRSCTSKSSARIALVVGLIDRQCRAAGRRHEHRSRPLDTKGWPPTPSRARCRARTEFLLNIIPEHLRRCLRQGRDPAGAADRGAVRLLPAHVRRPRHARCST